MPTILTGALADLGATSVPRLTGLVRYGLRSIVADQFADWALQRIMLQYGLSLPQHASKLLEFTLSGMQTAHELYTGVIQGADVMTRAPLLLRSIGSGAGGRQYVYRVVYDIIPTGQTSPDTRSIVIDSPAPLDLQSLKDQALQAIIDVMPTSKYPVDIGRVNTVVIVGVDFVLQVQL